MGMHRSTYEQYIERFLTKYIVSPTGCWDWSGCLGVDGRGYYSFNRKAIPAHRFCAEHIKKIPLKKGDAVCHTCDNPLCINPDHLFVATQQVNMIDMLLKDRSPHSSVTIEQVRLIRQDAANFSGRGIKNHLKNVAIKHKVSLGVVERIHYKKSWTYVV